MVSALVPGSSGPGSSPGRGHCVVFLFKTLNSHSASLHTGAGELLGKPNKLLGGGVTCNGLASRPGGVEILLAASCYGNQDKLWPKEPVLAPKASLFTHLIASKLNSTFGTIRNATADKMTAKVVEKLGHFALAQRINLNQRSCREALAFKEVSSPQLG